ncbi:nuclear transport factor 2 family protein [uncultured Polaribacter sp.]|uniref:nuclear transport factor 2 family protein n=1 Tax=uncultured Polaribacter sp. TaxID=174711 RepID=UPI00263734D1|nr:nuclear transport factor 2 family protein [uncultured Polaribacter sp.]
MINWHKAASNANYTNYFGTLDSSAVYIGTAAEEIWSKKQFSNFSKPYFDRGKAWDFKTLERNVYLNEIGDFAWFDELLNTWMGTCRGSGVLEKKNNTWKIKQYVLSVAIPNDDIKAVITAKKKNDSIFLNKYK